jgi:hypothetical protein
LERQDDILNRVITDDKVWVYQYDPEMKQQSARPKKFHYSQSRVKTKVQTFLYKKDFYYEFAPTGQSTSLLFERTGKAEKVRRKRPEL